MNHHARNNPKPFGVWLLATFALMVGCHASDAGSAGSDNGDTTDTFARDSQFDGTPDVEKDTTDDASPDSSDAHGGDDSGTDASDGGDDPEWVDCNCPREGDVCRSGNGTCADLSVDCESGETCPEGYECTQVNDSVDGELVSLGHFCLCDGPEEECRPTCTEDADCPPETACELPHGSEERYCTSLPAPCESDYDCPRGYLCDYNDRTGDDACAKRGQTEVGESCSETIECHRGVCQDGICTEYCYSDDDCPEGELCNVYFPDRDSNGCTDELECDKTCEPNTRCYGARSETNCAPPYCRTSGDCEEGDCLYQGGHSPGSCGAFFGDQSIGESLCKANEFRFANDDHFCKLPGTCDNEDDCPDEYTCRIDMDRPWIGSSYCSRRVVPEDE